MIRAFDLRDLPLLRRLSARGVSLHTESALTKNVHPLRAALFNLVGGEFPTYVWKASEGQATGFIQLQLEEDRQHAHILSLGVSDPAGEGVDGRRSLESAWLPMLDQAVAEVGRRGIHSLVAEVDELGAELPILRRAGFAIYTRQDVWVMANGAALPQTAVTLTERQESDDWEIQLLYANTVPRLVQLVEPAPSLPAKAGWILREDGELTAFVHLLLGDVGAWMRLYIHPNAETRANAILNAAAAVAARRADGPVYCCVRRYQSWLQSAMEQAGFSLWGSQAVMVKHTVHHLRKPLAEMKTAVDAQGIPVSTPIVRPYQEPKMNGKIKHSH